MWPWEHLAFGYALLSLTMRVVPPKQRRLTASTAVVLAVVTQFPDLVDKPLAWEFAILPSGLSLAHSLTFAVPFAVVASLLARRYHRSDLGVAVVIGYASHLVGDAIYPLSHGRPIGYRFLLWPFVPANPAIGDGLFATTTTLWLTFNGFLGTPRGRLYILVEASFLCLAAGLWYLDGHPGTGLFRGVFDRPSGD